MSSDDLVNPDIARIRKLPDWSKVRDAHVMSAAEISPDATLVSLGRQKASHKGIARHRSIRTLFASAVDQAYLDEICELSDLEYLWLGWPVTAKDLSGLARLRKVSFLKLDSPRNITDFGPVAAMPALTHLFVENARHLPDLAWLDPLKGKLVSLGIEGSMWTMQKVRSLVPLAGYGFEALCMTSVQLADKDLTALAECPNLKILQCARFAPKERFEELKALRPDIQCTWFDRYEV